jgi:hypothetical protein
VACLECKFFEDNCFTLFVGQFDDCVLPMALFVDLRAEIGCKGGILQLLISEATKATELN